MPAVAGRRRWRFVALATVLTASACRIGTDLWQEEQATLEASEALGIATALVRATVENTVFSATQVLFYHAHGRVGLHSHAVTGPFVHRGGEGTGPIPNSHNLFNAEVALDLSCESGGALLLEAAGVGEGNPLIQRGFIDYQWGQEHRDCGVVLDDGQRFVLSTPPYPTGEAHVSNDGAGVAEISGVLTGGIGWEGEAKAGECEFDLAFSGSAATVGEIDEVLLTGAFCEFDIDATVAVR